MTFLKSLFDERHEIAAWLVMAIAAGGSATGRLGDWPAVALVCVSLVTLLGSARYAGVSVGPDGVQVDGGSD
jgi:hypothetical protein